MKNLSAVTDALENKLSQHIYEGIKKVYFCVGAEVEFYIKSDIDLKKSASERKVYQDIINTIATTHNIELGEMENEDGFNQFELQTLPTDTPPELSAWLSSLRGDMLSSGAFDFSARPHLSEPGSALHFHISLYDEEGNNLFMPVGDGDFYQLPFYQAIGGLLKYMPSCMTIFAPTDNCYNRFIAPKSQIHRHYPVNYSWGINNRTCALRIPRSVNISPVDTRIEHRVCSATADVETALTVILSSLTAGICKKIHPPEPIFGNSFDLQYDHLVRFPRSLEGARRDHVEFDVLFADLF